MTKKKNRIIPKDCYRHFPKLSDSSVVCCPMFSCFIYATGQTVLVSAPSQDVAVWTLSSWLHSVGLDGRVLIKESYDCKDVLSHELLYNNAIKIRGDETLF